MNVLRFVETPEFTAQVQVSIGDAVLRQLQNELIEQPEKGGIMRGTGGFRKVRAALPGGGKSGGARVIYLYLPECSCIVFYYLFTKGTAANISDAGKAVLRHAAKQIVADQRKIP